MPPDPQHLLKPAVLGAHAYPVPNAEGLIKLDAMENPWPWPESLREAWAERLSHLAVNRYPDASLRELDPAMRRLLSIPDSVATLYGNGSDELIQTLLLGLAPEAGCVLVPEPTFVMYRRIADYVGLPCQAVSSGADFSLEPEAMFAAIERHKPGIIFIATPNNPTGIECTQDMLRAISARAPGLVVVDEAYFPYSTQDCVELVAENRQVLVLRTVSKLGLAGLRLGVLIGDPVWVREFKKICLPYNISTLSQASLCFVARHREVLAQQVARLLEQRDSIYAALDSMAGLTVWPSRANFLLFRSERLPASALHERLLQAGILLKNLHGSHATLENCLRVSMGTEEENAAFLHALRHILSDGG